jgi:hypothetical protein
MISTSNCDSTCNLETAIENIINHSSSIRFFNETFEGGLRLLREGGKGLTFLGFGKIRYQFQFETDSVEKIKMVYTTNINSDKLLIDYLRRGRYDIKLDLTRARGNLTLGKSDTDYATERLIRGVSFLAMQKKMFRMDPWRLVIRMERDYRPRTEYHYGGKINVVNY